MKRPTTIPEPARHMLDAWWAIRQENIRDCGPAVVARLIAAAKGLDAVEEGELQARLTVEAQTPSGAKFMQDSEERDFATPPGRLRNFLNGQFSNVEYAVRAGTKADVQTTVLATLKDGHSAAVLINGGTHWALLHGWHCGIVGVVNPGGDLSYPYVVAYDALWSTGGLLKDPIPKIEDASDCNCSYENQWVAVIRERPHVGSSGASLLDTVYAALGTGTPNVRHYFKAKDNNSPTQYLVPWIEGDHRLLTGFDGAGRFRLAALGTGVAVDKLEPTSEGHLAPNGDPPTDLAWLGFARVMSLDIRYERVDETWSHDADSLLPKR